MFPPNRSLFNVKMTLTENQPVKQKRNIAKNFISFSCQHKKHLLNKLINAQQQLIIVEAKFAQHVQGFDYDTFSFSKCKLCG